MAVAVVTLLSVMSRGGGVHQSQGRWAPTGVVTRMNAAGGTGAVAAEAAAAAGDVAEEDHRQTNTERHPDAPMAQMPTATAVCRDRRRRPRKMPRRWTSPLMRSCQRRSYA